MLRCDFLSAILSAFNPTREFILEFIIHCCKNNMGLNKVVDIGGSFKVFGFQREEGNVITCYVKFVQNIIWKNGSSISLRYYTHSGTENNISH